MLNINKTSNDGKEWFPLLVKIEKREYLSYWSSEKLI